VATPHDRPLNLFDLGALLVTAAISSFPTPEIPSLVTAEVPS
jgi:hypothetical protein